MYTKILQPGDPVLVYASRDWAGVYSKIESGLLYMWVIPDNEEADVSVYVAVPVATINYIVMHKEQIPLERVEKVFE